MGLADFESWRPGIFYREVTCGRYQWLREGEQAPADDLEARLPLRWPQ
jgi:hypothetical protein